MTHYQRWSEKSSSHYFSFRLITTNYPVAREYTENFTCEQWLPPFLRNCLNPHGNRGSKTRFSFFFLTNKVHTLDSCPRGKAFEKKPTDTQSSCLGLLLKPQALPRKTSCPAESSSENESEFLLSDTDSVCICICWPFFVCFCRGNAFRPARHRSRLLSRTFSRLAD